MTTTGTRIDLRTQIAAEFLALADLLDATPAAWDAPSLCEGWRTREVVAHMTMPARYDAEAFMAEMAAAGGDFAELSNTVAARDGASQAAGVASNRSASARNSAAICVRRSMRVPVVVMTAPFLLCLRFCRLVVVAVVRGARRSGRASS